MLCTNYFVSQYLTCMSVQKADYLLTQHTLGHFSNFTHYPEVRGQTKPLARPWSRAVTVLQSAGFRVQSSECQMQSFRVHTLQYRVQGSKCMVQGRPECSVRFGVQSSECRVHIEALTKSSYSLCMLASTFLWPTATSTLSMSPSPICITSVCGRQAAHTCQHTHTHTLQY